MNTAYFPILMLLIIIFITQRKRRNTAIIRKVIENRKSGGNKKMKAIAEKFINKECVIDSFDGGRQYDGVIKEVTDGAILIEKKDRTEAINLDFVIRIREYPRNKNGKKKSIVLD